MLKTPEGHMDQDLARTILGNIGDGIISVDASLCVIFANPMACSILHIDPSAIIGMNIKDVMPLVVYGDLCNRNVVDPFGVALNTKERKTYSTPMVVESVKEKTLYIEDSVSPICNSD